MLEGSYESSAPHADQLTTAEDSSVIRVENYRELVSAVLYLVSQGREEGTIQLYNYTGEVDADLTAACLEVATEDPLGAYCVDYIKHEYTRVVSYYQATVTICYRRTMEQVRSMVNVTGTRAIRSELQEALTQFAPEVVLRVAYFAEDEESLAALVRQAYYDTPAAALGMPRINVSLYPDSGSQRVVEILLTYPEGEQDLRARSYELSETAEAIAAEYWTLPEEDVARAAAQALEARVVYDPEGPSNAYDALAEGKANSEGLALTYALLCGGAYVGSSGECEVIEGVVRDDQGGEAPRFWNAVTFSGTERLYLDPTREKYALYTAEELFDQGYRWPGGPEDPEEAPQPKEALEAFAQEDLGEEREENG